MVERLQLYDSERFKYFPTQVHHTFILFVNCRTRFSLLFLLCFLLFYYNYTTIIRFLFYLSLIYNRKLVYVLFFFHSGGNFLTGQMISLCLVSILAMRLLENIFYSLLPFIIMMSHCLNLVH